MTFNTFSREELLYIYSSISDISLKEKIETMIFVDNNVINKILDCFDSTAIIAIDKSPNSNYYLVYFHENRMDTEDFSEAIKCIEIAHSFNNNTEIQVASRNKNNIEWKHYLMVEVWNQKDGFLKTELEKKDA